MPKHRSHEKIKIDVPLLLPDVPDERDNCVNRLVESLKETTGVGDVHVVERTSDSPARLCIHYDPDHLSMSKIRQVASRLGGQLTDYYGHVVWRVDGIRHPRRALTVSAQLLKTPGVIDAEATAAGAVRIEFERGIINEEDLLSVLQKIRVFVREKPPSSRAFDHLESTRANRAVTKSEAVRDKSEEPSKPHQGKPSDRKPIVERNVSREAEPDKPLAKPDSIQPERFEVDHDHLVAGTQMHGPGIEQEHGREYEQQDRTRHPKHDDGHTGTGGRGNHGQDQEHDHARNQEHEHTQGHSQKHGHKHGQKHDQEHSHSHGGLFGEKTELIFGILSGSFLLAGWLVDTFASSPGMLPMIGYLAAYFFGGFYTLREAFDSIRAGRFEIDFLMLAAAVGAAALGAWTEGALLLFLFSIGHALEHYAMGRARKAIEALANLTPDVATVVRNGIESETPVDELVVGDTVIVRPNSQFPADGFVTSGSSAVNQAPITGESTPVDKYPLADPTITPPQWAAVENQHRVFAGTINGSGALEITVARPNSDSTLAQVSRFVAEAETRQSPTQRFTNKFERIFVPSVLVLVLLLMFGWIVVDEPFSASFYRAMAVLVAASPCALAIATPSAVLSGIARAGRGGVLIKGGSPLERLGSLSAIAFDKTGTLTKGKPQVTDVKPVGPIAAEDLLVTALAVEKLSDHPLAIAIVSFGQQQIEAGLLDPARLILATNAESLTGRGIRAVVDGRLILIGNKKLFTTDGVNTDSGNGPDAYGALTNSTSYQAGRITPNDSLPAEISAIVEALESAGRTTMIVRRDEQYLGVIGLMDTPREEAAGVVSRLRTIGIRRMTMLSGDNQRVADAIAKAVGLDEALGGLMPHDKVDAIKSLRDKGDVAMIGDGVNDAPAMANATVGIAMGAAGSDVALETADVALMSDNLNQLPFAVTLSRQANRIIKQNLFMSLGMVVFLVPATIVGLGIGPAVALHEGSTLVVVFNALRLLAFNSER